MAGWQHRCLCYPQSGLQGMSTFVAGYHAWRRSRSTILSLMSVIWPANIHGGQGPLMGASSNERASFWGEEIL